MNHWNTGVSSARRRCFVFVCAIAHHFLGPAGDVGSRCWRDVLMHSISLRPRQPSIIGALCVGRRLPGGGRLLPADCARNILPHIALMALFRSIVAAALALSAISRRRRRRSAEEVSRFLGRRSNIVIRHRPCTDRL